MKVVNTFHQPSSVIASLKCALSSSSELGHLVIAKTTRIEVSSIHPEGLKYGCSLDIWGRVVAMRAVAAHEPHLSNILVLTDHPDPRLLLLEYRENEEQPSLKCTWHSSLYDRVARHAEFFTDIAVSPSREVAVVSCYVGKLKVIHISGGEVDSDFDVILPELNVYGLSVLHSDSDKEHTLAIIHMDHMQRMQLVARDLNIKDQDLSFSLSPILPNSVLPANAFPDTDSPFMLIPVPSFALEPVDDEEGEDAQCLGGVLILGGRKILFYEVASVEKQKRQKDKDKRQSKRKASANEKQLEAARKKDLERDAKKVKPKMNVKWPWSEVTAWCPADDEMRRFFIGDMYGRLAMLVLSDKPELLVIPLGETSPPTTLSYLTNQVLYVGSHMGESQIVQIHATAHSALNEDTLPIPSGIQTVSSKQITEEDVDMDDDISDKREGKGKIVRTKGSYVEVLESFSNIAPIIDAVLADTDNSGQPQIVTCSGGCNTGSINIVRTGANFQERSVLRDIPNATGIWPIRPSFDSSMDSHVLLSTLRGSLLFKLDGYDTAVHIESETAGFILNEPTLALKNVRKRVIVEGRSTYGDSQWIVQVTARAMALIEYDPTLQIFTRVSTWTVEDHDIWKGREIVAASMNPSQITIALSRGVIALFNLDYTGAFSFVHHRDFPGQEVSAISCATLDPTKNFSLHVAVGFWGTNNIRLLTLDPSTRLQDHIDWRNLPSLPSLPRSILLHNFGMGNRPKDDDYRPYVVAGLADGAVACFVLKDNELKDLKMFPLGTAPVSVTPCNVDGNRAVMAIGSRSCVLYWDKQRLRQSHVMVKDMAAGTSFNSIAFPNCQILATPSSLVIGSIRGVDKMQIQSISLGYDNPRRIAHNAEHRLFGVACSRPTPNRVGEAISSHNTFVLFDDITLDRLSTFVCDPDEEVTAVLALKRGGYFLVGTVRHQIGETEPLHGRLLLFSVEMGESTTRGERGRALNLHLSALHEAGGCVYALVEVSGGFAAAVNTSVDLYNIVREVEPTDDLAPLKLSRLSRWNHNYFVTSLAVRGDTLILGDAISSVSVLRVVNNDLQTVARHYGPLWPIAVESVRASGVIGANCDCNLFTFGIKAFDGRRALELDGNFHLGDVVNKFVPGGLGTQDTDAHEPHLFESEHLFFTSTGRIGTIHHVRTDIAMLLTALANNMSDIITGPGEVVHSKWRTPTNSRGRTDAEQAVGFLDGDFLEQFLTYPRQDRLLKGKTAASKINKTPEEIERIIEKLQGFH